jgi:Mrp family chromosome partitioning ATPase/capsular polysaccharide biosynthesis protein
MNEGTRSRTAVASSEERIDTRRYISALARSRKLIAALCALATVAAVTISALLPNVYEASSSIVLEDTSTALAPADSTTIQRELATQEVLLTSTRVLGEAAKQVPGETASSLADKVEARVDPKASQANVIEVTASDGDPRQAARIANAVVGAFLTERVALERARMLRAEERLREGLGRIQSVPGNEAEVAALQERLSQLAVSRSNLGSDLQVVDRAVPPSQPTSPRPLRNGVLAFTAALFLGVLIALARDQLSPRISDPRELGRLLGLRVLAGIPYVRRRRPQRQRARLLSGAEAEAYETLRTVVDALAPAQSHPVILVTGAVHAEGKTTVVMRLGQALARSGARVLLVSADLRVPRLHEVAGVHLVPGLSDLLVASEWGEQVGDGADHLEGAIVDLIPESAARRRRGCLHLITSGTPADDPGRLIASPELVDVLGGLRQLGYDYILLDAPPMLGIADSRVLARVSDHVLLVTRLDRLSLENVAELRDVVDSLDAPPLGLVVIGARGEPSPYYLPERPPLIASETI